MDKEMKRVAGKTERHIRDYFRQRGVGAIFTATQLEKYVSKHVTIAPGSAKRIMRNLRGGSIDYELISRGKSQYKITRVESDSGQLEFFAQPEFQKPGKKSRKKKLTAEASDKTALLMQDAEKARNAMQSKQTWLRSPIIAWSKLPMKLVRRIADDAWNRAPRPRAL